MTTRRTKIVSTIGPASSKPEVLRRLITAGIDVARVNLSHGTHAHHRLWIRQLRQLARAAERSVAVLFDLQGPKMRVGRLKGSGPVALERGRPFCITTRTVTGDDRLVSTTYTHLPEDVKRGDTILLDDGRIQLEVAKIAQTEVHCVVTAGGLLGEHKGINLPGVALSAPALTAKDLEDARFAIEEGADYFALSFVRSAKDVRQLRQWLKRHSLETPIIAKIERAEALERLDEILTEADGVMVARGDLGVELSLARVPILQKTIIEQANRAGKLVITATQMLESMVENPVPTRAEATDIANAIFDHTDAVMLSGETAAGRYPVEAVRTMHQIIMEAEHSAYMRPPVFAEHTPLGSSVTLGVVEAAAQAARDPRVKALMVFTMSGTTVQALCKRRPNKPIYALTAHPQVVRRMALCWGVIPVLTRVGHTTDRMIEYGERILLRRGDLKKGDLVIVVAGTTRLKGATNMMKFLVI
ncbi:MAG: pyruvate kinase [Deltaproteobacteria bacterium]|nr:pyruvate kinase [Deltaproteobacteria bacterium]